MRLEKKFSLVTHLDVGKCFDSIYTHSISWATKEKFIAKENTTSMTFGGEFDQLMQKMNINETNGICIGAEVSRIFAEIILSAIDNNIAISLKDKNIIDKRDYECRRYVDNYYVFTNSEQLATDIHRVIAKELKEYNLHLNELKFEQIKRPFYTKKSKIIYNANKDIESFFEKIIGNLTINGERICYPLKIYKHHSLLQSFIKSIKESCFSISLGYDEVSNYVISALSKRIVVIIDNYEIAIKQENANRDNYQPAIVLLLDAIFFFFSVHPTVTSSLRLANALVNAGNFLSQYHPEYIENLRENSLRWTSQLINAPAFEMLLKKDEVVPIEYLNILISLREIKKNDAIESILISQANEKVKNENYFTLISKFFVFRDHQCFNAEREELVKKVKVILQNSPRLLYTSDHVHLLLDVLSCPYIPNRDREELLKDVWPKLSGDNFPGLKNISLKKLIVEIQNMPWFVNWSSTNLLSLIEKKELSVVY